MNYGKCKVPTDLIARWDSLASQCLDKAVVFKEEGQHKRHQQSLARAKALQQAADELYGLTDAHLIPNLAR